MSKSFWIDKIKQISALNKQMNNTITEMLYGVLDDNGVPLLYRGLDA